MSQRISILCTPDNNYVPYCGIMLTSLFENNKEEEIVVYILCDHLNEKNIEDLSSLCRIYNKEIKFINLNKEIFDDCPIREGDHVSIAAYYRLFASEILPPDVKKILYLDCDIIINGNISNLYYTNIENYAFGAVVDEAHFMPRFYERLEYSNKYPYINSGVILFNLDYWRKNKTTEDCMRYISGNTDKIILHDQDTLNAVLHDKIKILPITYNFQTGFMFTQFTNDYDELVKKEINNCVYTPTIIHYTGAGKPWHKHSQHPYKKRFLYYRKKSLWCNFPLTRTREKFANKLRRWIVEIMWTLGIKKRIRIYIIKEQP